MLDWQDVVPVVNKEYGFVTISCKINADGTRRAIIGIASETVTKLGWVEKEWFKMQTAVDDNKRLIRLVTVDDPKTAGAIKGVGKRGASKVLYIQGIEWLPEQETDKKECFHLTEHLEKGELIVELPREFCPGFIAPKPNSVDETVKAIADAASQMNQPGTKVLPILNGEKPVSTVHEDRVRATADEIVRDDERAVLGMCRLHSAEPELKDGHLSTYVRGQHTMIAIATSWFLVLKELVRSQSVSGKLYTLDLFHQLVRQHNPKETRSGDTLIRALNDAYLKKAGLKLFYRGKYVAITVAE